MSHIRPYVACPTTNYSRTIHKRTAHERAIYRILLIVVPLFAIVLAVLALAVHQPQAIVNHLLNPLPPSFDDGRELAEYLKRDGMPIKAVSYWPPVPEEGHYWSFTLIRFDAPPPVVENPNDALETFFNALGDYADNTVHVFQCADYPEAENCVAHHLHGPPHWAASGYEGFVCGHLAVVGPRKWITQIRPIVRH